jgi:hypothetical protein
MIAKSKITAPTTDGGQCDTRHSLVVDVHAQLSLPSVYFCRPPGSKSQISAFVPPQRWIQSAWHEVVVFSAYQTISTKNYQDLERKWVEMFCLH